MHFLRSLDFEKPKQTLVSDYVCPHLPRRPADPYHGRPFHKVFHIVFHIV